MKRRKQVWYATKVLAMTAAWGLLLLNAGTTSQVIAHSGLVLSASGAATIDGVLGPGEWDNAAQFNFAANRLASEGGGTTPATLFLMNDGNNLYLAVRVIRSTLDPLPFGGSSVLFEFDNNHNGVRENGDDVLLLNPQIGFFDEVRTNQAPPCPPGSPPAFCGVFDSQVGGANDGQGAATNNGTFSFYEISHPLNSTDDSHDFSLSPGSTLGFFLMLLFCDTQGCADTFVPGPAFGDFGDIVISGGVQPPTGLSATVGNQMVFLYWNPPPHAVDGYNLRRGDGSSIITINLGSSSTSLLDFGLENGRLYNYTVSAVKNGVESSPSNEILARPGEFAVSKPPSKPANPILFLHGICIDPNLLPTNASTWDATKNFLTSSVGWKFGGSLFYLETDDPQTTPPVVPQLDATADFYTVSFGHCQADYVTGRAGLLHQGDEVQGFVRELRRRGVGRKLSIVAHSMGGIAARSYITSQPQEAVSSVQQFITYGTPHWGASFSSVFQIASPGARDLDFDCTNGRLDYSGSPFFEHLRGTGLPTSIRYFAIRGHNNSIPHRGFTQGCLSTHWDIVIPVDSADFLGRSDPPQPGQTVPQGAPVGQVQIVSSAGLLTTNRLHTQQTNDVSAILCSLDPNCFILRAASPIDIQVAAPDGRLMSPQVTEIPGAAYTENDDEVAHSRVVLLIPFPLDGDYSVSVTPKPGASPTATFTLEVTRAGVTTKLAQDVEVQNIPGQPYAVSVLSPVVVDIQPGSPTSTLNLRSQGRVPVAILSTPQFDASGMVDRASLTFGRFGDEPTLTFCSPAPEDINADGLQDLMCHFAVQGAGFVAGDTHGVLKGQTKAGTPFLGSDSVRIIP